VKRGAGEEFAAGLEALHVRSAFVHEGLLLGFAEGVPGFFVEVGEKHEFHKGLWRGIERGEWKSTGGLLFFNILGWVGKLTG
jgi:hypothetical protein